MRKKCKHCGKFNTYNELDPLYSLGIQESMRADLVDGLNMLVQYIKDMPAIREEDKVGVRTAKDDAKERNEISLALRSKRLGITVEVPEDA